MARMIACAARGAVRVRFLIDGVARFSSRAPGSRACTPPAWKRPYSVRCWRARLRDRAICATTANGWWRTAGSCGRAAATLRRNISAETAASPPWLDLSFDLQGPVAASVAANSRPIGPPRAATRRASPAWSPAGPCKPTRGLAWPTAARSSCRAGPTRSEDTVHALLIDACFHATHRILAVTPYFVPDASLGERPCASPRGAA